MKRRAWENKPPRVDANDRTAKSQSFPMLVFAEPGRNGRSNASLCRQDDLCKNGPPERNSDSPFDHRRTIL